MANTNQLTRVINSVIYPKAVLIAYVSEDEKKHFLEMRAIDKKGNMGEGRPVTLEYMTALDTGYCRQICCIATLARDQNGMYGTIRRKDA